MHQVFSLEEVSADEGGTESQQGFIFLEEFVSVVIIGDFSPKLIILLHKCVSIEESAGEVSMPSSWLQGFGGRDEFPLFSRDKIAEALRPEGFMSESGVAQESFRIDVSKFGP